MRRVRDTIALLIELGRYLAARPDSRGQLPFNRVLLERIASGRVRPASRASMLGYLVISALGERNYSMTLQVLKDFAEEMPWDRMSVGLLRKLFEVSVIHDELAIARRVLSQLAAGGKVQETELESPRCLVAWRAGQIRDEASINSEGTYFTAYPEYDEYFKGRILTSAGRLSEATEHFRKCLALAPADALELRADVLRRI